MYKDEYCKIVVYCLHTQLGRTVLHLAAEKGNASLIEHFINAGINVNTIDNLVSSLYVYIAIR